MDASLARLLRSSALAAALLMTLAPTASAGSAVAVTHGSRQRPMVALTFDDGWSRAACRSITDTLRAHRARGTFFILGEAMAQAPAAWRSILKGFPVANHTHGHRHLSGLPGWAIRRQIAEAERVVEKALRRPMLKILRPPYGEYDSRVLRIAGELGYRYSVNWDTTGSDTSVYATPKRVIKNATRGTKGSIVLMHCGPAATPPAVDDIIRNYRSRGFKLVTLRRLLDL